MKHVRTAVAASAAALLTAVGLAVPLVATAANGTADDITADIVKDITVTSPRGDGLVELWNQLKVEIALETTTPVDEGDFFVVAFPEPIGVSNATFNLEKEGEVLGTCVSSQAADTITCTLNALAATKTGLTGSIIAEAQAVTVGTYEKVTFNAGTDHAITTTFPSGQVLPENRGPVPSEVSKTAWQTSNADEILWSVYAPSKDFDAGAQITIVDRLVGNHTFPDPLGTFRILVYADDAAWASGTTSTLPTSDYTLSIDADRRGFTLTFANDEPGTDGLYQLQYMTQLPAGSQTGEIFGNTATVNGQEARYEQVYRNRIIGTLDGPGTGSILVAKTVSGQGAALADGKTFSIQASWTDAEGSHTQTLTPTANGASAVLSDIPTGTVVTLTELTTTDIEGVHSYVPTFSAATNTDAVTILDGGTSAEVTIVEQTRISIRVDNEVTPRSSGGYEPTVSVGDYVWEDVNRDGLQDATDVPIPGVTLTLTGPDGQPVTDVNGNLVAPTTTDETGWYEFVDLPALQPGEHYTVTVTPPAGYQPTTPGVGGDRATDSSTGFAESTDLTEDGDRDDTLDFGYVKVVEPTPTPTPSPSIPPLPLTPGPSTGLPVTGGEFNAWFALGALALLAAGGAMVLKRRRV